MIAILKQHLNKAAFCMKQLADKRRSERSFKDLLPQEAKFHNVFHVSLLKLAYAYVTASLE